MVGTTVREALNLFDPRRPLEGAELDTLYVARPYAPLEALKVFLQVTDEPVKVLFSGHRGSGKSTELRRLARDLEKEFYLVSFSVSYQAS
jgi:hypothetical protein